MKKTFTVSKPVGKTPYQVVQKLKEINPSLAKIRVGYAGRLDPMAEGVLLLLIGDTNKSKHAFEGLKKKYTFQAVLGMETDTYDVLGLVQKPFITVHKMSDEAIKKNLLLCKKTFLQTYPPYSSIRVKGKPLFYWAREGKLADITIPTKEITIYSINNIKIHTISSVELQNIIYERIKLVEGNFRQEKIITSWNSFFKECKLDIFQIIECSIYCSSGTYVRSLVQKLGKGLQTKATTLSIKRTAVGYFSLKTAQHIFTESTE